jgi:membrane-bound serine protease (ClpP class)
LPEQTSAKVGEEGVTVSQLRPNGKALINDEKMEVYSLGEYVDINVKVKVIKIADSKIFVKPINS